MMAVKNISIIKLRIKLQIKSCIIYTVLRNNRFRVDVFEKVFKYFLKYLYL